MAKKKKKKKQKPPVETEILVQEDTSIIPTTTPPPTLDSALSAQKSNEGGLESALKGAKETQTDLQGLISNISEGEGFFRVEAREKSEEGGIVHPQLSYDSEESKVVRDFMMEGVPLTDRKIGKSEIKSRARLVDSSAPKTLKKESTPSKPIKVGIPAASPIQTKVIEGSTIVDPSFAQKQESIYPKLEKFFQGLIEGYSNRYNQWEESISSILLILRKMRKFTKLNTEQLVSSITDAYKKVTHGLDEFVTKRNEVESLADINIDSLSQQFKQVLGMLELQVKEYQLKVVTDEFIRSI